MQGVIKMPFVIPVIFAVKPLRMVSINPNTSPLLLSWIAFLGASNDTEALYYYLRDTL